MLLAMMKPVNAASLRELLQKKGMETNTRVGFATLPKMLVSQEVSPQR
jgi:hypothetical protein